MRLGHVSEKGLLELSKQGQLGSDKLESLFCEHCVYGKCHIVKFSTGMHTTKNRMDYIHFDL